MRSGKLRDRIRIDQRSTSTNSDYGTQTVTWTELATVWAEVLDVLPSRGENITAQLVQARQPVRVRMRYRADVDSAMRVVELGGRQRTLKIVGGPATLGNREGSEVMCEEFSTEGEAT